MTDLHLSRCVNYFFEFLTPSRRTSHHRAVTDRSIESAAINQNLAEKMDYIRIDPDAAWQNFLINASP